MFYLSFSDSDCVSWQTRLRLRTDLRTKRKWKKLLHPRWLRAPPPRAYEVPSADFLLGLEYFRGTSILRSVPGGEVQVREVVVLLAPVSAEDTHPSRPILLSSPPMLLCAVDNFPLPLPPFSRMQLSTFISIVLPRLRHMQGLSILIQYSPSFQVHCDNARRAAAR